MLLPLILSATVSSSAAVARDEVPFTVEADSFRAFVEAERFVAEGSVVLTRAGLRVTADRLDYDRKSGLAVAAGSVTAIEGNSIVVCQKADLRLPELSAVLEQAVLRLKDTQTATAPGSRDRLYVKAARLERKESSVYELKDAAITACDCGDDRPSWSFTAESAEVDLDSGAWLTWPVLRVKDVPVMILPAFYVPLGERRTGLLTPRFRYQPQILGFQVRQPLFITLGRSWDMTIEPAFNTARGPAVGLELRYQTSTTTQGRWNANYIADLGEPGPEGFKLGSDLVSRFSIAGRHRTDFKAGSFGADINLISDPAFVSEFADNFLARQAQFTRSTILGIKRWPQFRFAGQVHLLQDLRGESYINATELRRASLFSGALEGGDIRYRFAELRFDAPYQALLTQIPLAGSARVSVQAFAAPRSDNAARFVRVDARPQLELPIGLGDYGVVTPRAFARFTAWSGRDQRDNMTASRGAVGAGAGWSGHWFRAYDSVLHRLTPHVDWLAIPWVAGDAAAARFSTRDELDLLAEVHQLSGGLTSALSTPAGSSWLFKTEIARDLGLGGNDALGFSELLLESDARWQGEGVSAGFLARAALLLQEGEATELSAGARLDFARFGISTRFIQEGPRVPRYRLRAAEELTAAGTWDLSQYVSLAQFDALTREARQFVSATSRLRSVVAAVRVQPLAPLTISGAAVLSFDDPDVVRARYGDRDLAVLKTVVGRIAWDSPCRCWNGFFQMARARDQPGFQFDFGLELSPLGTSW